MSSIVVSGDTSGAITISAPAVAGTNTITLPANTGTVITTASSGQVIPSGALPAGSVIQVVSASLAATGPVSRCVGELDRKRSAPRGRSCSEGGMRRSRPCCRR